MLEKRLASETIEDRTGTTEGSRGHMSAAESLQDKEFRFIRDERRRLQERGITNYDEQSVEIATRLAVVKQFVDDTSANVDVSQPVVTSGAPLCR